MVETEERKAPNSGIKTTPRASWCEWLRCFRDAVVIEDNDFWRDFDAVHRAVSRLESRTPCELPPPKSEFPPELSERGLRGFRHLAQCGMNVKRAGEAVVSYSDHESGHTISFLVERRMLRNLAKALVKKQREESSR